MYSTIFIISNKRFLDLLIVNDFISVIMLFRGPLVGMLKSYKSVTLPNGKKVSFTNNFTHVQFCQKTSMVNIFCPNVIFCMYTTTNCSV